MSQAFVLRVSGPIRHAQSASPMVAPSRAAPLPMRLAAEPGACLRWRSELWTGRHVTLSRRRGVYGHARERFGVILKTTYKASNMNDAKRLLQ